MKLYQIKTKQQLPIPVEKAWNFFSNPKNLKESIGLLNFLGFDDLARETSIYLLANKVDK